eukprot:14132040-Alexandrium_andersonii.AAC.1
MQAATEVLDGNLPRAAGVNEQWLAHGTTGRTRSEEEGRERPPAEALRAAERECDDARAERSALRPVQRGA